MHSYFPLLLVEGFYDFVGVAGDDCKDVGFDCKLFIWYGHGWWVVLYLFYEVRCAGGE